MPLNLSDKRVIVKLQTEGAIDGYIKCPVAAEVR